MRVAIIGERDSDGSVSSTTNPAASLSVITAPTPYVDEGLAGCADDGKSLDRQRSTEDPIGVEVRMDRREPCLSWTRWPPGPDCQGGDHEFAVAILAHGEHEHHGAIRSKLGGNENPGFSGDGWRPSQHPRSDQRMIGRLAELPRSNHICLAAMTLNHQRHHERENCQGTKHGQLPAITWGFRRGS